MLLWCLPSSFSSIQFMVWEEMLFEEFQDGSHLWYRIRTILTILNLHVSKCLPPSFRLSRLTVQEQMLFEDFEVGCYASYQVLAQSNLIWEEMSFEEFQNTHVVWYQNWTILAVLNLDVAPIFSSIRPTVQEEMSKMWKVDNEQRQTDNRRRNTLTWSFAPGELTSTHSTTAVLSTSFWDINLFFFFFSNWKN